MNNSFIEEGVAEASSTTPMAHHSVSVVGEEVENPEVKLNPRRKEGRGKIF